MPEFKFLKIPSRIIRLHCLFWLPFIAYEVLVTFSYTGKFAEFHTYVGAYLLNIFLFYANTYLVFAKTITPPRRSYLLLIVLIMLELAAYIFLKWIFAHFYIITGLTEATAVSSFKYFIIEGVWRAVYFIGLSTAYWFALTAFKHQRKIAKLENKELRSQLAKHKLENAYLQAQINPHFLFNTLSFLYNTVNKLSSTASQTVLMLSDMMRYALNEQHEDGRVELDEELSQIRNFILLAQMRHEHALNVKLEVQGEPEDLRIIPLVLITLVENVFKYAELKDLENPALISLTIDGNRLDFHIANKKRAADYPHSHGIGVANVKKRLEAYYSRNYSLDILNQEDSYNLHLTINL